MTKLDLISVANWGLNCKTFCDSYFSQILIS
jgi:hypothetical protein